MNQEYDCSVMHKTKDLILNELLSLSHNLGDEANDYVIVGEGNTSARIDSETFWVKASGQNLRTITLDGFVEVRLGRVLSLVEGESSDEDVTRGLMEACVKSELHKRPSVETILHAVLYHLTDAKFIGHTHAVAINVILCSQRAHEISEHIMPDVIVVCGKESVFVPYTDPGLPLARQVHILVRKFVEGHSQFPRMIYLQNHGLFALGQSARQVENITAMAVKHARVLAGTYSLGGPHWLAEHEATRIDTRPDEEIRRDQFK
jgi:rhamnose utilization protein RhaD (predicted bifunctional aldolase and dehydrogenase)